MKLDLFKTHKAEYVAPKQPALVQTKPAQYLAVEGRGEPGGAEFQAGIGALYKTAFTAKMASKRAGRDYAVCKLECLWSNLGAPRDQWQWQLLIRTPDFIKGVITLKEGRCVQMLHVGPYEEIGRTVAVMEAFAAENKLRLSGVCHEVYLSDPRKTAPAKLRTILRRSVVK